MNGFINDWIRNLSDEGITRVYKARLNDYDVLSDRTTELIRIDIRRRKLKKLKMFYNTSN